jgi:hypothetical protein
MRKTFAYPDSDDDSEPDGLDEEEQEKLIEHLMQADAQKTENYKVRLSLSGTSQCFPGLTVIQRAFLVLPILSIVLYIPSLGLATLLTHALAITSLLGTAYAVYIIPSKASEVKKPPTLATATLGRRSQIEDGPLRKYIDHLNAGICVILALQAIRAKSKGLLDETWLAVLPCGVFLLLFLVRTQLKPVDIAELEKLRYGYKGA